MELRLSRQSVPAKLAAIVLAGLLIGQSALAQPTQPANPAELTPIEADRFRFPTEKFQNGMVVSDERQASQIGVDILRQGGNAMDAAVATAYALAVTLPRAGNLGGGGFLVVRDPKGQVISLDFRETAPSLAHRNLLLDAHGDRDREKATIGGLAVGVPGTPAGLDEAHRRFGRLTRQQVVAPARRLAQDGYIVPAWLHEEVERVQKLLGRFPSSRAVFHTEQGWLPTGHLWRQPDLAKTLLAIENQGAQTFYQGQTAQKIAAAVQQAGGVMKPEDFQSYKPIWRDCVVGHYRDYRIISMPPPSSGGVHLIQALNVLSGFPLREYGHNGSKSLHLVAETLRQVYADRSRWLGDPAFCQVPVDWLTSKEYADQIRSQIPSDRARSSPDIQPGDPKSQATATSSRLVGSVPYESPQTTHFCVVDKDGMAVSVTYTLNFSFGSGLVADGTGVLLNNEMDDFAAAPGKPNAFGLLGGEANSIQPGKRPLSSMTPTIIEKDGQLYAVIGSLGGSRIITIVLQLVLNLIDYDLSAQTSAMEPRFHHQWYPDQIEVEQGFSPDTIQSLQQMGHNVVPAQALGHGLVILKRKDGLYEGGADHRRAWGAALGY